MMKTLMRKAKFTEVSSLEKSRVLGKEKPQPRPRLRDTKISDYLRHYTMEYLGHGLVVDPRLTRFRNGYFWVRGSKKVPADVATAVKFARKYFAASSESGADERVPVHRRLRPCCCIIAVTDWKLGDTEISHARS